MNRCRCCLGGCRRCLGGGYGGVGVLMMVMLGFGQIVGKLDTYSNGNKGIPVECRFSTPTRASIEVDGNYPPTHTSAFAGGTVLRGLQDGRVSG